MNNLPMSQSQICHPERVEGQNLPCALCVFSLRPLRLKKIFFVVICHPERVEEQNLKFKI
jgi:hypothetical protein